MLSYRMIEKHGEFIDYVEPEHVVNGLVFKTVYTKYLYLYRDVYYLLDPNTFEVTIFEN